MGDSSWEESLGAAGPLCLQPLCAECEIGKQMCSWERDSQLAKQDILFACLGKWLGARLHRASGRPVETNVA